MTLNESRKQADEMFEELKAALVPMGWSPGQEGLCHLCDRELLLRVDNRIMVAVKVSTNAGHGDGSGVPSVRVDRLGTGSYGGGVSVGNALQEARSRTQALAPLKETEEGAHE